MTYQTVAAITQTASLLFFIVLFIGVLAYVFWPGNQEGFDRASKSMFDADNGKQDSGEIS